MKQLLSLLLLSLLVGTNVFGMDEPKMISVKNNIGLNRDLSVAWTKNENELEQIIPAGTVGDLHFNKIDDVVTFSVGGEYLRYTSLPVSAQKEELKTAFRGLNPVEGNKLEVEVLQNWRLQLYLTYHLAGHTPLRREQKENVLYEFPRLASYLPQLPGLTEETVNGLGLWFKVVEQHEHKKAKDIYRYILGLPKECTKVQVEDAYKALALYWHSDKVAEQDRVYADRVFKIIRKAHDELKKSFEKDSWKYGLKG